MMRYFIGKGSEKRLREIEFDLSLKKPFSRKIDDAFIKTYKPVLDDAPHRIFNTMRDYRNWCRSELPSWLGYGP
ncbi:MAG: hypothetical protein HY747_03200 [Elusimicrobia bacterium]|nr:hypothetical protein [Elusimicrobiota bacterium]